MSIESWLASRQGRDGLGAQAERVFQTLIRSPQFASYASARELAERAGVNVSTVVRTAQQLGFEGWPDLRSELRTLYIGTVTSGEFDPGAMIPTDAISQMLRQDVVNVASVISDDNVAAIRATADAIKAARRTVVLTTGSGAGPAQVLGHIGVMTGYDIHVVSGPATAQAAQVMQLGPEDLCIVISVWRLTRILRGLARLSHERGVTVSVLTDLHSSPLAEHADHVIVASIEGIRGSVSLTAMVAVVQAILAQLFEVDARRAVGAVEQAWDDLDLMDDQP